MNNTILDDDQIKSKSNKSIPLLLAIGMFLFLSISGFAILFQQLFKDIFAHLSLHPFLNLIIRQTLILIALIAITSFTVRKIKQSVSISNSNLWSILWKLAFIFVLSQVFQSLYSFFAPQWWNQPYFEYLENSSVNGSLIGLIDTLFIYIKYIAFGIVIIKS